MTGAAVRAAGRDDSALLARLHAECFAPAPWSEPSIREVLAVPGTFGLLLLAEGHAAGFVLARVVLGDGEILSLAVRPHWRRRGLGRRLVQETVAGAVARGAKSIRLEVAEDNHAARGLYEDAGFLAEGRRANYYARPGAPAVAAIVLARALP